MENRITLGGGIEAVIQEDAFIFKAALNSKKVPFRDISGYYIYPFMQDKFLLVIAYTE